MVFVTVFGHIRVRDRPFNHGQHFLRHAPRFRSMPLHRPNRDAHGAKQSSVGFRHREIDRRNRTEPDSRPQPRLDRPGPRQARLIDGTEPVGHDQNRQIGANLRGEIGPITPCQIDRRSDAARSFENSPVASREGPDRLDQLLESKAAGRMPPPLPPEPAPAETKPG